MKKLKQYAELPVVVVSVGWLGAWAFSASRRRAPAQTSLELVAVAADVAASGSLALHLHV